MHIMGKTIANLPNSNQHFSLNMDPELHCRNLNYFPQRVMRYPFKFNCLKDATGGGVGAK